MQYRGTPIELRVSSVAEEAEMRIAALVKGVAVERKKLAAFWVESDLVGEFSGAFGTGGASQNVSHSLIKMYKQPRASATALFTDQGDLDASEVSRLLASKESWLLSMDRTFAIEIAFLSGMLGSGGEEALQPGTHGRAWGCEGGFGNLCRLASGVCSVSPGSVFGANWCGGAWGACDRALSLGLGPSLSHPWRRSPLGHVSATRADSGSAQGSKYGPQPGSKYGPKPPHTPIHSQMRPPAILPHAGHR